MLAYDKTLKSTRNIAISRAENGWVVRSRDGDFGAEGIFVVAETPELLAEIVKEWAEGIQRAASDGLIKHMVDRFLSWSLPEDFNPDAGISYTRPNWRTQHPGPSGTNLLDATQAEAMIRYMVDGTRA